MKTIKAWGVFDEKQKLRRTHAFIYNSYHVAVTKADAKLWYTPSAGETIRQVTITWEEK